MMKLQCYLQWGSLVAFLLTLTNCSPQVSAITDQIQQSVNPTASVEQEASIENIAYLSGQPHDAAVQETVTLLAYKYSLEIDQVQQILHQYLTKHNTFQLGAEYTQTIETLSQDLEIPTAVLAKVILDYRVWLNSNKQLISRL
jgi:hypothetical protein